MLSLTRKVFANLLSLLNAISKFQQLRISLKDFLNFVLVYNDNSPRTRSKGSLGTAGFSMNILYADDKSPVQKVFSQIALVIYCARPRVSGEAV